MTQKTGSPYSFWLNLLKLVLMENKLYWCCIREKRCVLSCILTFFFFYFYIILWDTCDTVLDTAVLYVICAQKISNLGDKWERGEYFAVNRGMKGWFCVVYGDTFFGGTFLGGYWGLILFNTGGLWKIICPNPYISS